MQQEQELREAITELGEAIEKAVRLAGAPGITTDWIVCYSTRTLEECGDLHTVGYITDSIQDTPDYRSVGLVESVRDIFRNGSNG